MQRFRLIDTQLHGVPATHALPVTHTIPTITPEIARKLGEESRAIRAAFRARTVKMWDIPASERKRSVP